MFLPRAVYIHIPFCEQICHYCDFNKFFIKNQPVSEYLNALEKEIALSVEKFPIKELDSIFVGGGTPTALTEVQLEHLLSIVEKYLMPYTIKDIEYTFEANPGEVSIEKLRLLKGNGVNRLSFGVQAFQDKLLEKIGRIHRVKDVYHTLELANKAGFTNINLDLMYGLPGQTMNDFKESLDIAISQNVQHFSAYSLQIEPKTVFYNLLQKGRLQLPTSDTEADMYELLLEYMGENHYFQYEISNFSKKGYKSVHNLTYWNNEEYFGFGAGAHSFVDKKRNANVGPLNKYISMLESGILPYLESNLITKEEGMEEELFLGLRKTSGVSISRFEQRFNVRLMDAFKKPIEEQVEKGLLMIDEDRLKLTKKGLFLGNEVFQAFLAHN